MNIYIGVEIAVRELDSSLLLATLAAEKGHHVIVSDLESITKGLDSGVLAPGIFHTKSLTPSDHKIARHKNMIDKGLMITSIDEEAGLDEPNYDGFAITRYSEKSIEQSSAVFTWGPDDVNTLNKFYPKLSSKFHKTGSPRSDLWKSMFINYWGVPQKAPKRPFLLISSNMTFANEIRPFYLSVRLKKKFGYYQRDAEQLQRDFGRVGEDYKKTFAFIEAIKYLANNNNGYDIVLRPHPAENIEAWKFFLEDIPNVHVIREGSITAWVSNAFAVMHNRCTTAIEATFSKKPVVTYVPFQSSYHANTPSNKLGHYVESLDDLLRTVNELFNSFQLGNHKDIDNNNKDLISNKIFFDSKELASEKIVKVWDSLIENNFSKSSNWMKFELLLKVIKLRKLPRKIINSLSTGKFENFSQFQKFPSLKKEDINERVSRLQHVLGIKNLQCKLLSDRTILIKRN